MDQTEQSTAVVAPRPKGTPEEVHRDSWPRARAKAVRRVWRRRKRAVATWGFNRRAPLKRMRREHVLCFGDSNVLLVRDLGLPKVWIQGFEVGGATASGRKNPNNKLAAHPRFSERMDRGRPWQNVMYMLGGVDCSFSIWYYVDEEGVGVEEEYQRAVDGYTLLLEQSLARGFARVIVVSAPLSTIPDNVTNFHRRLGKRSQVSASQIERTQLTLRFNAEMKQRCERIGAIYVDVSTETLDPDTGVVAARFVRTSHANHHVAGGPFREAMLRELSKLFGGEDTAASRPPRTPAA